METHCHCGNELIKKTVTLPKKHKDKWYIIEDVPALICQKCGEHFYDGPMMIELEKMLDKETVADREIIVPVYKCKVA